MEDPPRLIHSNPEFARFVTASNKEEPATNQLEQALSLAAKTATTTRWGTFRWLRPGLALGAAILGASVVVVSTYGARERAAVTTNGVAVPVASAAVVAAAAPIEAPVTAVSVNDFASSSVDEAPRGASAVETAVAAAPVPAPRTAPLRGHDAQVLARGQAVRAPVAPSPSTGQTTFSAELALVSAARSALEAGDVRACMREVDRYEERFRAGLFAHEIEVIRIEALAASGEQARTKILVDRFLASNPNSPYADLVRSLTDRTTDHPQE